MNKFILFDETPPKSPITIPGLKAWVHGALRGGMVEISQAFEKPVLLARR